mmetsp:Transcript_15314/g.48136  ORF Transcript_15314/g.48136 Transcript_15314/m.48136 type:complete len:257 (-) Transcript_15314:148-918(-)
MPQWAQIEAHAQRGRGPCGGKAVAQDQRPACVSGIESTQASAAPGGSGGDCGDVAYLTGGTGAPVPDIWSAMDGIGAFDPVIAAELGEIELTETQEELERALGGAAPLAWASPKESRLSTEQPPRPDQGQEDPLQAAKPTKSFGGKKDTTAAPEGKAATVYFSFSDFDPSDLTEDPLVAQLEERLLKIGLAVDDLPGPAEGAELTEVLKELGFTSAIERTKLRKAVRERRSWSLGVLDSSGGQEPPGPAAMAGGRA